MQASTLAASAGIALTAAVFSVAITLCVVHPRQPAESSTPAPAVAEESKSESAPAPIQEAPVELPPQSAVVTQAPSKASEPVPQEDSLSIDDLRAMSADGRKKADESIARITSVIVQAKDKINQAKAQTAKAEKIKALSGTVGFINDLADSGIGALDKAQAEYVERIDRANRDYGKTLATYESKLAAGASQKKIAQKVAAAREEYGSSLTGYLSEAEKAVAKLAELYGK